MAFELRLIEDSPLADEEVRYDLAAPRAIYVAAGAISHDGGDYPEDEGFVATGALTLRVGPEGATLWRWELAPANTAWAPGEMRSTLRLASEVKLDEIATELLIRLDSVAFPPGGTAMLHVHQGPGIRCLREGSIRIDTGGHSASYGPGSPWFELGPEPVFAQGAMDRPSRFIRCSILPKSLLGTSSIRYVNEEDRDKPKSQTYRGYGEMPFDLA